MKRLGLLAVLLLAACGGTPMPEDGFGEVKYGMSSDDLKRAGFTCETETECEKDRSSGGSKDDPIFTKPDKVTANLTNGAVTSIDLWFRSYSDDETISAYTEAYGEPAVCRFQNVLGATVEHHIWSAGSGASITVSKILDYGFAPNTGGLTSRMSTATYRDAEQSRTFEAERC